MCQPAGSSLPLLLLLLLLQYVPESAKMVCGRLLVQMPPTQPQEAYDPAAYLPGIWWVLHRVRCQLQSGEQSLYSTCQ
jgi:hypothetical protein